MTTLFKDIIICYNLGSLCVDLRLLIIKKMAVDVVSASAIAAAHAEKYRCRKQK